MSRNTFKTNLRINTCHLAQYNRKNNVGKLYRYFHTEEQKQNFLSGIIPFSGTSKNRFDLHRRQEICNRNNDFDSCDQLEYQNINGSFIGEYSLSFTTKEPSASVPHVIKLTDIDGFVNQIILALEKDTPEHKVSWYSPTYLMETIQACKRDLEMQINNSEILEYIKLRQIEVMLCDSELSNLNSINVLPEENDEIELPVFIVGGKECTYVDKYQPITDSNIENIFAQNKTYANEHEYRFHLNTGAFRRKGKEAFELGNSIASLVEYIEVKCENISQYCEELR